VKKSDIKSTISDSLIINYLEDGMILYSNGYFVKKSNSVEEKAIVIQLFTELMYKKGYKIAEGFDINKNCQCKYTYIQNKEVMDLVAVMKEEPKSQLQITNLYLKDGEYSLRLFLNGDKQTALSEKFTRLFDVIVDARQDSPLGFVMFYDKDGNKLGFILPVKQAVIKYEIKAIQ
jgi:hypothetical protein